MSHPPHGALFWIMVARAPAIFSHYYVLFVGQSWKPEADLQHVFFFTPFKFKAKKCYPKIFMIFGITKKCIYIIMMENDWFWLNINLILYNLFSLTIAQRALLKTTPFMLICLIVNFRKNFRIWMRIVTVTFGVLRTCPASPVQGGWGFIYIS